MTETEIKVVAAFMALEGDIAAYRFGTTAKKVVMEQLNISTAGLSNYISSLIKKGFLIRSAENVITILPILIPEKNEQIYIFKLVSIADAKINTGEGDSRVLGASEAGVS